MFLLLLIKFILSEARITGFLYHTSLGDVHNRSFLFSFVCEIGLFNIEYTCIRIYKCFCITSGKDSSAGLLPGSIEAQTHV